MAVASSWVVLAEGAEVHGAEREGADLDAGAAEGAVLHGGSCLVEGGAWSGIDGASGTVFRHYHTERCSV